MEHLIIFDCFIGQLQWGLRLCEGITIAIQLIICTGQCYPLSAAHLLHRQRQQVLIKLTTPTSLFFVPHCHKFFNITCQTPSAVDGYRSYATLAPTTTPPLPSARTYWQPRTLLIDMSLFTAENAWNWQLCPWAVTVVFKQ